MNAASTKACSRDSPDFHSTSLLLRPITLLPASSGRELRMALMTWKNRYSVGVKTLDSQPAVLIGILNDLHAAMMKGQAQSLTGPLLRKLVDYTQSPLLRGRVDACGHKVSWAGRSPPQAPRAHQTGRGVHCPPRAGRNHAEPSSAELPARLAQQPHSASGP